MKLLIFPTILIFSLVGFGFSLEISVPRFNFDELDLFPRNADSGIRIRRDGKDDMMTFAKMQRAEVSTPKEWINDIIQEQNRLRDLHGVPPLTLDTELTKTAQFYAGYLGRVSEGRTLPILFRRAWFEIGGNMWAAVGRKDANHISPTFAWYNEERYYTYGNDSYCGMEPNSERHHVDHFTQLIWNNTKTVGCAKYKNKSKHIYVVCHYQPPGNVRGSYDDNVPKPLRSQ